MKIIITVLTMLIIWLPILLLVINANRSQMEINRTPALYGESTDGWSFAIVIGFFSLLTTILLGIWIVQNNWL